jgi:hypothetical protein
MPAPDAIVHDPETGEFMPAMFHYASESCDAEAIAAHHGFNLRWVYFDEVADEDHPLFEDFCKGESRVLKEWQPPEFDDRRLVGKIHTEDGPCALYFMKREAARKEPEAATETTA